MLRMTRIISNQTFFLLLLVLILLPDMPILSAAEINAKNKYELAISFELEKNLLHGTAHLTLAPLEEITLFLEGIETTGILVENRQSPPTIHKLQGRSQINIPASKVQQEVFISYKKTVKKEIDNFINEDGITLISNWHPRPSKDVVFSLSATVPEGFVAIAESDHLTASSDKTYSFSFSHPITTLNFIAAPFSIDTVEVRPKLKVYTYFYKKDKELAASYLQAASDYIRQYEKMIGPYPYNHFAIVENLRPTGYGMPTFTLLGQRVIRLPFIISTSLGHEILHSWFGNAVRVDDTSGNWSEGLTSYLADWTYRELRGEGAANRKENIIKYLSYVSDENSIPLELFRSASHHQSTAKAVRSVGYIKGAMLFHELKNRIGHKKFDHGISLFYKRYTDKKASWQNIQDTFEEVSRVSLDSFFTEKLTSRDIAELMVDDLRVSSISGTTSLHFTLNQKTPLPYHLSVPIEVKTIGGDFWFHEDITSQKNEIQLSLESSPLSMTIDPNYDLMRKLSEKERVPTLSSFLGPAKKTIIIASHEKERFAPLLDFFSSANSEIVDVAKIKNSDLEDTNLIFLGIDNRISRSLFGPPTHPDKGLTLDLRSHPLNNEKNSLLVSCSNKMELEKVIRRLSHYGKYSYLHFENGRPIAKTVVSGNMGQKYTIEQPPVAVASSALIHFPDLINNLSNARAIYIGESHTSMTDHRLQLRLIEELFNQNPNIAIGMEMFPQSSQKALDDFIENDESMSEKDFLKQSHYFQVWQYDYRYYREIINFAKKNSIPLIGLNIDRDIVSSVYKTGSTDALTDTERDLLPLDRDLDMAGYHQRLSTIHGFHLTSPHGQGGLGGFIQAQGIWDEIMAETIADYLENNPEKRMIILAGAQHTRKDSGIPPRVHRRIAIEQQSILSSNNNPKPSQKLADYYIALANQVIQPSGKIGVTLESKDKNGSTFLQISQLSFHSKAKESGIHEKDILLSINGYPVNNMEDVRIAMIDAEPGDTATLELERRNNTLQTQQLTVTVELYDPEQIKR